jgi:DNA-directed RNA polymerase subunit RPC12/RpoP
MRIDVDVYDKVVKENESLRQWVDDLQSGMYINCVYCGYRYGPKENTPVTMADILKEHMEKCPEHPLSKAITLGNAMANAIDKFNNTRPDMDRLMWMKILAETLKAADEWKKQINKEKLNEN